MTTIDDSTDSNILESLKHGIIFDNKQNDRLYNQTNAGILSDTLEGFYNSSSLSRKVYNDSNISQRFGPQINGLNNLQNKTLQDYEMLLKNIATNNKAYYDRISPKNPYINKYVRFKNGQICYVTNYGVAKPIQNSTTFSNIKGKNGCPNSNPINLNIDWLPKYNSYGVQIPTTPPLISGTKLNVGESCGSEGQSIFVNKIIDNPEITYKGCYKHNSKLNTFIGSQPNYDLIINGNFSQPSLDKNSYKIYKNQSIPGWQLNNSYIVNTSNAWGYKYPYPNGNQLASIQMKSTISQSLNLKPDKYTLSFDANERPAFHSNITRKISNKINVKLNNNIIFSFTAPRDSWQKFVNTFNVTKEGPQTLTFEGTVDSVDVSTGIQGVKLTSGAYEESKYTYEGCKNAALDNGYKYFGLQDTNAKTGKGFCFVTNDGVSASSLGKSYVISETKVLWSSKTTSGSTASLTLQGTLSVLDPGGVTIFNTPNDKREPRNYIGCYRDSPNRTMQLFKGGVQAYDIDSCEKVASEGKFKYFGLQNSYTGRGAQCTLSNDLTQIKRLGVAGNCTNLRNGTVSGGGWSNAVYTTGVINNYILVLEDDGNMNIYKGTNPNDKQYLIWSSNTKGKELDSDSKYIATNGKFGKNWISSGDVLAKGEFIGSNNGKIYLIMQSDGNLVLYTSVESLNCSSSNGNYVGGPNANAIYEYKNIGNKNLLGNLAFINEDNKLMNYSSANTKLSNNYTKYSSSDSPGNNIGSPLFDTTDSICKQKCNSNANCYGYTINNNKVCYLKNKYVYPSGMKINSNNTTLYLRNKEPHNLPNGISKNVTNVDSVKYSKYANSSQPFSNDVAYKNIPQVQKQQLGGYQNTLNGISNKMKGISYNFEQNTRNVDNRTIAATKDIEKYIKDLNNTNSNVNKMAQDKNVQNILNDMDILALKENYSYLIWSILAISATFATIKIVKNTQQ